MRQNSPFLLHFPVFAQLFVSHAPVCGGAWRLGGRLVGGMAGLRRTVPVFLRRDGHTAPLQTVCGVCGGGCGFGGLHARQRDAVLPLQRGAGLLQICHSLFCPPCPAPDSRFPLADLYLRQLLRATKKADLSQAQNPAAFAETDELFDVSDRTKVYLKSRKFSLFLQTQRDFALKRLGIHKGFLRLYALHPACVCEISVIFFVFRYTSSSQLSIYPV